MSNCPDLVLIHLGTNDVTSLGEGKTLPQLLSFTPTSVNNVNKIVKRQIISSLFEIEKRDFILYSGFKKKK